MDDLVARLHNALVDALRQRSTRLDQPVTVAEIYQDLIPYRTVRSFGFALNADYEYALLQLLAGEGRLARIEPAEVREELRLELLSPNPNVGMFRQYAACDVFVIAEEAAAPAHDQGDAVARAAEARKHEGATPRPAVPTDWLLREEQRSGIKQREAVKQQAAPVAEEAPSDVATKTDQAQRPSEPLAPQEAVQSRGVEAPAPNAAESGAAAASAVAEDDESGAPTSSQLEEAAQFAAGEEGVQSSSATVETAPAGGVLEARNCYACGMTLPPGRAARFCPFCGKDQQPKCANCKEDLDPNWRFCIACGIATV